MSQQQPITEPRKSFDWLPIRAKCPDGRLRMVNVRHRWTGESYQPAEDVCGRLPARADAYQGFRNVPGFYAGGSFYLAKEE
jgi:hypothetical protein